MDFNRFFEDKTLRMDVFHTGTSSEERFSLDELYQEPVWPDSKINLIDTLNFGKTLLTVFDLKTNRMIYTHGFSSIFSEWQTTTEARNDIWHSFGESMRIPWPKAPVKITVEARDKRNMYRPVWTAAVDPSDPNIIKTRFYLNFMTAGLMKNGDPHEKIDLLILPDGYTLVEMKKFRNDAKRLSDVLFDTSPFKERRKDFNVHLIEAPSNESGIDDPNAGKYRDNLLSCSFNALNTDRYVLTLDNKTMRKLASRVPYDQILILVNESKYGGGGIYNLYAICTSDNEWSSYVFIHEFGHSFGGLGDEYYTSDVSYIDFYGQDAEPWEPNVAALLDRGKVKWQSWVKSGTPIPTPWDKETYDREEADYQKLLKNMKEENRSRSQIDSLAQTNERRREDFFRSRPYWGKVGAFEGSGYSSRGLYRPFIDCIMFSKSMAPFDPVCINAIERVIDFHAR